MFKYSFSITALLFLVAISANAQLLSKKEFRFENIEVSKINYSEFHKQNNTYSMKTTRRDLFAAGILSFIVPGAALGQFYKEEFVNGAVRVGISAVCIVWFLLSPPIDVGGGSSPTQKFVAAGIYAINWIASIIDASSSGKNPAYRRFRNFNVNF